MGRHKYDLKAASRAEAQRQASEAAADRRAAKKAKQTIEVTTSSAVRGMTGAWR